MGANVSNTTLQRQFYPFLRGEILAEGEQTVDVAQWFQQQLPPIAHRISEGITYMVDHNAANLADAATVNIELTTGAATVHIIESIAGKSDFDFEILEEPTTTGGTSLDSYNRNRASTNTATATAKKDVAVSNDGTIISKSFIGGGGQTSSAWGGSWGGSGGGQGQDFGGGELILKTNTKYVFRFTSRKAANKARISLNWYEVT